MELREDLGVWMKRISCDPEIGGQDFCAQEPTDSYLVQSWSFIYTPWTAEVVSISPSFLQPNCSNKFKLFSQTAFTLPCFFVCLAIHSAPTPSHLPPRFFPPPCPMSLTSACSEYRLVQTSLSWKKPLNSRRNGVLYFYASLMIAAAKLLQLCLTLCDPIDGSPPGSPVPGILQARTPEWVSISFSNAWKWKVKGKSFSRVRLLATPWTAAYQAPLSMGFSRQEYWSGVPLPSPSLMIMCT